MSNTANNDGSAEKPHIEDASVAKDKHIILILDYGSQYSQLITRRIREMGFFSVMVPGDCPLARIEHIAAKAIVLSGGPESVHEAGAPALPPGFFDYVARAAIPVLGICYGMQLIVSAFGGEVAGGASGEFGSTLITVDRRSALFGTEAADSQRVWMSHGDSTTRLPEGFACVATSEGGAKVAIENPKAQLYGLQYHPEVRHSERGTAMLSHFVLHLAGLHPDWTMASAIAAEMAAVRAQIGPTAHVICALSGGVDSTVAAKLVHQVVGDRLHCVFVDNGLLRLDEGERVMQTFKEKLDLPVVRVDASEEMLGRLKGVEDPEAKRKAIGAEFVECFRRFRDELHTKHGVRPEFLVQGTLYPDVIESCPPPGSDRKHSHTIKSHHNVGGLPADFDFKLVEPLRELFKDEVRLMGKELGVPQEFLGRHPFPGPGLAVRVLGDVTAPGALDLLRQVDEIYINSIREAGLYDEIWQAFAVLLPCKSVGVQGDRRSHSRVVALRAVCSSDGMTAEAYPFQPAFLAAVSTKICNEVRGVNRVCYDVTSKPPGTIEWE